MSGELDFAGLNSRLLSNSRDLVSRWLPGGKVAGREYICGSVRGGKGRSLSVNLESGMWLDGATGEKGGDLVSLYAAIRGFGQGDAFKELASLSGYDGGAVAQMPRPEPAIVMPPADAPVPPWGDPVGTWAYRDAAGALMFWIVRYDAPSGKVVTPWGWEGKKWIKKGWAAPRPLYGLEILAQRGADAPVLVVEGEKAADAARRLAGHAYVVMTWPNGASGVHRADWSPLKGHKVLIWPDADDPGARAAFNIAALIYRECPEVKILVGLEGETPKDAYGPILDADDGTLPLGWDAADAVREGWDWAKLAAWARPRARLFVPPPPPKVELLPAAPRVEVDVTVKKDHARLPQSVAVICEKYGLATLGRSGLPLCNVENVMRALDLVPGFQDLVWWDDFHERLFTQDEGGRPREWSDYDTLALLVRFQRELGFQRLSDEQLYKALLVAGRAKRRNEPMDWLDAQKWDGKPRVEAFFSEAFGSENSPYVCAASRNWWLSLVARVYEPGCKVDTMVVLEGAQGAGKSTALAVIGGPWFAEITESVLSKDFYMALAGKILLEVSELDAFSRADVTRIKQIVSSRSDRYRAPYARQSADYPRRCVFVGTTNESAYLRDATGGRRFWPVPVVDVRLDLVRENRAQLFAEAVHLFKAWQASRRDEDGWWVMPSQAVAEQESRRIHDEWETVVAEFIERRAEDGVTLHEIWSQALNQDLIRLGRTEQFRLSHILKTLRWKNGVSWRDGRSMRLWKPVDPF